MKGTDNTIKSTCSAVWQTWAYLYNTSVLRSLIFRFYIFTIVYLSFGLQLLIGQNYVPNPGFEESSTMVKKNTSVNMKSKLIPDSWNISSGWGARLCSCKTKITDYMKLHGFCNIKEVPLTDGCQMVQMTISDAQDFSIDKFRYGLTTYAHVKLDRTLRVGKKYRVSIQSYFPERSNYKSTIHSRTGIKLFNKEINTNNVGVIYTDNFLALDQLTTNKWNKSEWIIAPLCELNYLTVGFFSNDDVSNEIFHHFSNNWVRYYYFIDDIRVEEYEGDEEFVHYDCYDESQVNIRSGLKDSLILLFDQSEFILETEHKDQLDSFYQKLIAHPHLTINIIGNADSYGSYNYKLSSARANEVLDYMLSKGSVSKERFNVKAAGDENAILEIGENEKNQKFRNVTIYFSELTIEEKFYRQIIKSLINGKDAQVNKYLNIYNHITEVEESIHLLFDPRIKDKLSDEQRSLISEKIKKENGIVSFFLDSMYIEDQYDRTYQFKLNSLTGFHEFDQNENQYNVELVTRNNDDRNLSLILKYLEKNHIPKRSEVGRRLASVVPLIINHSMDTVLYNDYLPEFREMCLEGELSWKDYANIYDRDLMLRGIPQEYGTQFIETENRYLILYKHIQEDQLNENRLAIGLEPIDVHQKLKLK